ncbi:aldehyde dehydrogenase (NADP(+)) [Allopontixanthobacter sediminis]|uniref:2,5-dioxovalerate dehydrogenase n=1 Tax=Allopontixanthobacter sediminis TaxID=1689985 RepID=A0A845B0Y8_9SPHN|nr:aldehyde dehydrogenase (NADP(+)) [Allopontixanthobacter sediminis]MXP43908.1 aldehyde dehydrogenase family protein [Allopontixanthobacter sediminis]
MLHGKNLIAGDWRTGTGEFRAHDAASGNTIEPSFQEASAKDVADACAAAAEAQRVFGNLPRKDRAAFLRSIADKIDALGSELTERAMSESGLPEARLNGERGRTVGQLRLFAAEVENGAWQALRIDHADPSKTPPKPDLRLRKIPLGPVAVFGASNFPLAFSVAGGDTASALAAGCCVVVKGHPAHPGTSEMVATAIAEAVAECGLPAGVFSLLNGTGYGLGEALVKDPRIAAVGFTGSRAGGLALLEYAAARAVPIPVYAEMSSINPVVLMPARMESAAEELAKAYVGSLSLGAGQFCTNPGIVLAVAGGALERFVAAAADALTQVPAQTMLTSSIHGAYDKGVQTLSQQAGAQLVGEGAEGSGPCGRAVVYTVSAEAFRKNPAFEQEVFGPSSIIVSCASLAELAEILEAMEGQLTTTLHMEPADYPEAAKLLPILEERSGRVIANAWPTGVDVTHAMVHGGPFPATSDGRSTSVGTLAIDRFLRPVSYQDMPEALLPDSLSDESASVLRRIDGTFVV